MKPAPAARTAIDNKHPPRSPDDYDALTVIVDAMGRHYFTVAPGKIVKPLSAALPDVLDPLTVHTDSLTAMWDECHLLDPAPPVFAESRHAWLIIERTPRRDIVWGALSERDFSERMARVLAENHKVRFIPHDADPLRQSNLHILGSLFA